MLGKDSVHVAAQGFAFFLIHFHTNLIGERVDARVAVVSAVGAVGRKAFRREGKFKKIGIGVGANPPLVRELKISARDIRTKSSESEGTDFEFNANAAALARPQE